jgi:malonyl-CoA decarboxylase
MSRTASDLNPASALDRLRLWWRRLTDAVLPARGAAATERANTRQLAQVAGLLETFRTQRGGELSARQHAAEIAAIYRGADLPQRAAMLALITQEFAPDRAGLEAAMLAVQTAASNADLNRAEAKLRLALNAPRAKFLAHFNLLPDGVKFLVDVRADLLKLIPEEPGLEVLQVELDGLLTSWFDPGFLELRRISWQSPALVLEKLMAYEAVHPIESWNDLRNRLDTDRRCYAFFHPRLPDEPLIFVEIALLKGFPESVQMLLDVNAPLQNPQAADTAVFYSISNTQKGLRGISFGNLLLKRVILDLQRDLPELKHFVTLSPIPGFRKWLTEALSGDAVSIAESESAKIAAACGRAVTTQVFAELLADDRWNGDERLAEALREPLERLCARYLLQEKAADGKLPRDPVASFHLNNGARVNRLLWLADTSARGMRQSHGLMVSYGYDLDKVDENHERFAQNGEIAAARRIRRLVD